MNSIGYIFHIAFRDSTDVDTSAVEHVDMIGLL